jgi:hypothetical protein
MEWDKVAMMNHGSYGGVHRDIVVCVVGHANPTSTLFEFDRNLLTNACASQVLTRRVLTCTNTNGAKDLHRVR